MFMNAELEYIRDNLKCAHCEAVFKGTDNQARHVKYERTIVYCSSVCRAAAMRIRLCKPIPNRGPCLTCGKEFFSRTSKVYCNLQCYIKSPQFYAMSREATKRALSPESRAKQAQTARDNAKLKIGPDIKHYLPCIECGKDTYQKPSTPRKFCSKPCYRSYMAKRFDRWIANPEGMALPQCYDEFLDREELTCIVEGCGWQGRHLSVHVNQAHGIRAQEFKRAAGFNLNTGLVSKPLAQLLSERPNQGVALSNPDHKENQKHAVKVAQEGMRYYSMEAKEHQCKAHSLLVPGPIRNCRGCGIEFRQNTQFGRAVYCSKDCRKVHYSAIAKANSKPRIRNERGLFVPHATTS